MSMSQSTLLAKVKRYLAGDESSPSIDAIHDNTIVGYANDLLPIVVKQLEPIYTQALHEMNYPLAFTSGVATSPTNYCRSLALKVGDSDIRVRVEESADDFASWDSNSFIFVPTTNNPIGYIADGNVFVKPTSFTAGKLDYVKNHPDISGSQNTLFDSVGDALLIELVVNKAKQWLGEEVG